MVEQLDDNALTIYTDGSSFEAPRRGGVGARFVWTNDEGREEIYDFSPMGYQGANSQQMELEACIEVLRVVNSRNPPFDLARFRKVVIYSDSLYLVNGVKSARFQWSRNGWKTSEGAPVLNDKQWRDVLKQMKKVGMMVDFKWVKGHKTSEHNRAADKLARSSAQRPARQRITHTKVRRKVGPNKTRRGSVEMLGQYLTIHISGQDYLAKQRCYAYRYGVVSPDSPFFLAADLIFAEHLLNPGHTYDVRVNDDTGNPRILEVFREAPTH